MSETAKALPAERRELLETIWTAEARAVLQALADNPIPATLQAARQFLVDNGISLETLGRMHHVAPLPRELVNPPGFVAGPVPSDLDDDPADEFPHPEANSKN